MSSDERLKLQNQMIKAALEELQFTLNDSFYKPQFRKEHLEKAEEFLKEAMKVQKEMETS
ncbi:hypothetical protein HXA31_20160 [Salipaludibacillus agaradhaerens]|uniref:hypothetical protein n=1 Tax=Salipaludibacillus TaxID=1884449 RepID=UPI0020D00290|nr:MULTISPECIES: hypothetical protein [Salipaludibacillus]MCR6116645.1 hypothetical protein [Salipaludibacillus agaradhaerens]UTR13478.1 hypothetical protein MM221_12655 [Salipaludibacillus sp. LMS25]